MNPKNNAPKLPETLPINKSIRSSTVLVIGEDGLSLGIHNTDEAIKLAQSKGLDLAQVSTNKNGPPTCKLLNYDKYRFEAAKKLKEKARQTRENEGKKKEIQLTPRCQLADLKTKARHCNEFLNEKCEVKIIVKFKGREKTHIDVGEKVLLEFLSLMPVNVRVLSKPSFEEKTISCVLSL